MPFSLLFSVLSRMVFRVMAMVIFSLAMVITILMTIASEKMTVSRWPENGRFRHRCPLGERTDKTQKPEMPSPRGETEEMYIYAISEKYLRYRPDSRSLLHTPFRSLACAQGGAFCFLPFYGLPQWVSVGYRRALGY